jgi:hypothetical protein
MKEATYEGGEQQMTAASNKDWIMEYNVYHWGPLLFKTTVRPSDITALRELSNKAKGNWSKNLAGIIKDERSLDSNAYTKIVQPYLKAYHQAYKTWYSLNLTNIETKAVWVNFMKKGESNPPHIHHNCHLSSVIFIDIPDAIKEEQKNWKGTGEGPAGLTFFTGNPQNFHTNSFNFRPEVGDFFIFPWNLTHSVNSFYSDVTRISIAANFLLKDNNIVEDDTKKA